MVRRRCATVPLMRSWLVPALGWLLAVAATGIVLPQLLRVVRTRRDDGVSLRTCVLAAVSMSAWAGYTAIRADVPAFASSTGPLVVWVSCGWIVARRRGLLSRFVVALVSIVALVMAAGVLFDLFHVLAVSGSLLWILPQLQVARRQGDLAGVSVAAYVLLTAENIGWVLYAWGTATPAYAFAPLVQGPLAATIAIYAWRGQHRSRRHDAALDVPSQDASDSTEVEFDAELFTIVQDRLIAGRPNLDRDVTKY